MKPILPLALLGALSLAAGAATTTPVGYSTFAVTGGFNFVGLTLHEATVFSGEIDTVSVGSVTVVDNTPMSTLDLTTILDSSTTYILEVQIASGVTEVITSVGTLTLGTTTDLTSVVSPGDPFSIRPAATLESLFGTNGENLRAGFITPATGDEIWIFNGTDYDKYFYDSFAPAGWEQTAPVTGSIDPSSVTIDYAEGFVLVANSPGAFEIVFDGEVKLNSTELNLAGGFNFASSVAPVGATLATAFGVNGENIRDGFITPATGDEIWIFNGLNFDKYFYDGFAPAGWEQTEPVAQSIDPTLIALPPGYIVVSNDAAGGTITQDIPPYTP